MDPRRTPMAEIVKEMYGAGWEESCALTGSIKMRNCGPAMFESKDAAYAEASKFFTSHTPLVAVFEVTLNDRWNQKFLRYENPAS